MAAHCPNCGERFQPQSWFCASCGTARTAPIHTRTPQTAPVYTPQGAPGSEAHTGRQRGIAIASVIAVAVAGGVAGAVLWTSQHDKAPSPPKMGPAAAARPNTASVSSTPSPPSSTQSFADLYRNVSSGIVRIQATTCDGGDIGTGFLIAPNLVATVAHVVNESAALNLTVGEKGAGGTTSGVVVGIDPSADVALVRLGRPMQGHVFTMAALPPSVGQEVAAIGFPVDDPMTFTHGTVSGLDRTIPIENVTRSGLIETDAPLNPGNSGGPLLSVDGQVVGLVDAKNMQDEGIAYAVAPNIAHPLLQSWADNTASVVVARCANPVGPQGQDLTPTLPGSPDTTTQAVGQVLKTYFDGINSADYEQAWLMLSPRLRGPSWSSFAKGTSTSLDSGVALLSVTPAGQSVIAHVTFTSVQASEKGPGGDTCDNWDLDYTLVPSGDSWLIDKVLGHNGGRTHTAC